MDFAIHRRGGVQNFIPPMSIPDFSDNMETPMLVLQPPGQTGLLVERVDKRRRTTLKQFPNAHAALDWCEQERILFLYMPAPDVSGN